MLRPQASLLAGTSLMIQGFDAFLFCCCSLLPVVCCCPPPARFLFCYCYVLPLGALFCDLLYLFIALCDACFVFVNCTIPVRKLPHKADMLKNLFCCRGRQPPHLGGELCLVRSDCHLPYMNVSVREIHELLFATSPH